MGKILIIDDDVDFRLMLRTLLERNGYEVDEADDGIHGMGIFRKSPATLVITDIIMPDMDGIETIIEMRKKYPGTKLIAISGGGRIGPIDYLNAARALGANRVFTKPFDNTQFLAAVASMLGQPDGQHTP